MTKTRHNLYLFAILFLSLIGFAACSEEDDTVEEYPNWVATNDAYFNNLSETVVNAINSDPAQTEWKRIKCWSKQDSIAGENSDYILVKVLSSAPSTETASPLSTDTVAIHYSGQFLPSTSYPSGYVFDQSYNEPFDEAISVPKEFVVNGVVDGLGTALQRMHRGDHWMVYIPYQLAYGNPSTLSSIPDGSTLIFDLRLVDFWSPGASD